MIPRLTFIGMGVLPCPLRGICTRPSRLFVTTTTHHLAWTNSRRAGQQWWCMSLATPWHGVHVSCISSPSLFTVCVVEFHCSDSLHYLGLVRLWSSAMGQTKWICVVLRAHSSRLSAIFVGRRCLPSVSS